MSRAVFVGRFQPFHQGHQRVIEENLERFDELLLAVGSAAKEGEQDNPLSFEERKEVIEECFPEIEIIPMEDEGKDEEGNKRWITKLMDKTGPDAVISQNDLVKRLVKEYTDVELHEQQMYDREIYSGTEIRRRMRSGEEWRYLVPDCAVNLIEDKVEKIKKSGIEYDFEPGWKKENAYHDTYEK